ncbi:MAG: DUF5009 domain-containing protein, partial [Planctomycetota bacterium]
MSTLFGLESPPPPAPEPHAPPQSPAPAPGSRAPATLPSAGAERLLSLDVFRGITIAGMILVNNPGNWGHVFGPLRHADWHGLTPTDLVFPFFLFIVGAALPFSFDKRMAAGASRVRLFEHVVRRSLILFMLGMILAAAPKWEEIVHPVLRTDVPPAPLASLLLPVWPGFDAVVPY